jgi:hypothetical protein
MPTITGQGIGEQFAAYDAASDHLWNAYGMIHAWDQALANDILAVDRAITRTLNDLQKRQ